MNFVKANFKYIRKEKFDYTQTEIAKFLGIDRGNVSSYEDGRAKVPIEVMLKLVDVIITNSVLKLHLIFLSNMT